MHESETPSLPAGVEAIRTLHSGSGYVCEVPTRNGEVCGESASQRLEATGGGWCYRCAAHESVNPPVCQCGNVVSYYVRVEEYITDRGAQRTDGPRCSRCMNASCARCRGCERWIARDSRLWNEGHGGRCTECVVRTVEEIIPVSVGDVCRSYGGAVVSVAKGKSLPADVLIGTEFEAKVPTASIGKLAESLQRTVGIKRDGSLNSTTKWQGIEIITPPRSGKAAEALIKSVAKTLRDNGCKVDSECGYHVHIDGRAFIPKKGGKVAKIARLWNLYSAASETIQQFLPSSRRGVRYCQRLEKLGVTTDGKETLNAFQQKVYGIAKRETCSASYKRALVRENLCTHYNSARYYEMNLHSLFTRGTIEFRAHSGTLNERKAIEWAALHVRLVSLAFAGGKRYKAALSFPQGKTEARKHLYKVLSLPRSSRSYFNERAAKFAVEGTTYETNYEAPITKNGVCAA